MSTGSKTAQTSLVLKPGSLRPRVFFLHFFDLHFLEERGAYAKSDRAVAEMDMAVRFAVILGRRVLVPASSYYENEVAARVLKPFLESDVADRFKLVGGGSSVEEFRGDKTEQYRPGSTQHLIYSKPLEQATGWERRKRSSTRDIISSWLEDLSDGSVLEDFHKLRKSGLTDAQFERAWLDVPERLGEEAFIVPHVAPFLPVPANNMAVESRLHRIINRHYFQSYATDFGAAVFQNMSTFGGDVAPSGNPQDDVDFAFLVKMCRGKQLLAKIQRTPISQLDTLCFDNEFIEAFSMTQPDGYAEISTPQEKLKDSATGHMDRVTVDLAIVTALSKELEAVETVFGEGRNKSIPGDPHVYKLIDFEVGGAKKKIAVAVLSGMGNNPAAITATDFLRSFAPKHIWMVGIAGGCPVPQKPEEHVRLGDVVIGKSVLESDFGKLNPDGTFTIRDSPQRVSYQLVQIVRALQSERTSFNTRWLEFRNKAFEEWDIDPASLPPDILTDETGAEINHPEDTRRKRSPSLVHFGNIAAGDVLLKNREHRDHLQQNHSIVAVEMESAGLRDAGWARDHSIGVVRGIVDYCDGNKDDKWHIPGALSAAAVARLLFEELALAEAVEG